MALKEANSFSKNAEYGCKLMRSCLVQDIVEQKRFQKQTDVYVNAKPQLM